MGGQEILAVLTNISPCWNVSMLLERYSQMEISQAFSRVISSEEAVAYTTCTEVS